MKQMILGAALVWVSCAGPQLARTTCGMRVGGESDGGVSWLTNEDLQVAEDATLSAAARWVTDPKLANRVENCRRLAGYQVYTHSGDLYSDGKTVGGYTKCVWHLITLQDVHDSHEWRQGALAHELLHAIQECPMVTPVDPEVSDVPWPQNELHGNWYRDGYMRAVQAVQGGEF